MQVFYYAGWPIFLYDCPQIMEWSSPFIRNISSVNSFKKSLKTHLFQKAFLS